MKVRDVDEFMMEIDEFTCVDVERWEDEKGVLKYLIMVMEKPIHEVEEKVFVRCREIVDSTYIPPPLGESRGFSFGSQSHWDLMISVNDQKILEEGENASHEAIISAINEVQSQQVTFDDVLDETFEFGYELRGEV